MEIKITLKHSPSQKDLAAAKGSITIALPWVLLGRRKGKMAMTYWLARPLRNKGARLRSLKEAEI